MLYTYYSQLKMTHFILYVTFILVLFKGNACCIFLLCYSGFRYFKIKDFYLKILISKQSDLANLVYRIGILGTFPGRSHPENLVEDISSFLLKFLI